MATTEEVDQSAAVDLEAILAELEAGRDHLPREAIARARQARPAIIPRLIEAIRRAADEARAGKQVEGNAHFIALFLLAEFRAREALPAIVEAVSLPGDLPSDLFGDVITETLPRILATLASDRLEVIDELIANRAADYSVRWSAARTIEYLVRDGVIDRTAAVERLGRHLREGLANEDGAIVGPLIAVLVEYAPAELLDDIREAYRRGLADPSLIDQKSVERDTAAGEETTKRYFARLEPTAIDDTIEELEYWASFQEEQARPLPDAALPEPLSRPLYGRELFEPEADEADYEPATSKAARVGRNDPCPCGSGKKYKKCCGARH